MTNGTIELDGIPQKITSPKQAIEAGIVLCPEDRKKEGIIPTATVGENINISARRSHNFLKFIINDKWEKENAEKQHTQMNVKTPSIEQLIVNLSGGNQQKAILGRWLSENIKWREEQQMVKAQHPLHTSNAPIYYIARQLGYDFSRLFKRHTGLNPSEYRNSR